MNEITKANEIHEYDEKYSKYFVTLLFEQATDVYNNTIKKLKNVDEARKLREYFIIRYFVHFTHLHI